MLTISQSQYDTLSAAMEQQFVERVRLFLESDYPEAASVDVETGRQHAIVLIDKAKRYGLSSQAAILTFITMLLDYFTHEPHAYMWAHELLSTTDISEEEKILGLENRLYGAPKWA